MQPVRLLLWALAWLAYCTATLVPAQAPATSLTVGFNTPVEFAQLGILPKGSEETPIDSHGAQHVEQVFLHRFSNELGNVTLRAKLEAAVDVILSAPEQLRTVFSTAPYPAQIVRDDTNGHTATDVAIRAARALAAAAGSDSPLDAEATLATLRQLSKSVAALSPGSCHPITRRVVLASLVRLQLRLHSPGLTPELQALRSGNETARLLFHTYRHLFNKHRQGAAVKGAIEFLHVSKSGGTSMCSVADRNGCVAASTTNFGNCMVHRFDDRPRWVSAAEHNRTAPLDDWRWYYRYLERRKERGCEYRDEYMHRKGFTFYSNEFTAHGGLEPQQDASPPPGSPAPWASAHLCPHFLNVLMIRQPLARLVSHVRWIIKVYRTEYGRSHEPFFRGRDADYWRRFAPAAVDNYYIRLLLGEAVFYAPTESLNTTHLAAARLVLLQYDVVLLLEAPDMDELWLRLALGWRSGLASAHARVAGQHRSANDLMPYDMDELMAANELDGHLYDFGAAVHQLDGLMLATVAAAGLLPYAGYDGLDPSDEQLGKRVKCGYVTRADELLAAVGEDVTAYERRYGKPFPPLSSAGERKPGPAAVKGAAQGAPAARRMRRMR